MSSVFRDRPNKVPPSYNPIPDTFTPLPQQRKPRDEGKLKRQFYTDIKRVFRRNPTHTTLSQRDYDTAVATNSIYQEDPSAYLQSKSSPYRINRQVSRNVMSLRNIETSRNAADLFRCGRTAGSFAKSASLVVWSNSTHPGHTLENSVLPTRSRCAFHTAGSSQSSDESMT